jgi:hypothetical protein
VCVITADRAADDAVNTAPQAQVNIPFRQGCRLDVNDDRSLDPGIDGLMILRYQLGLRGDALISGLTLAGFRTDVQAIEVFLAANDYDVRGNMPSQAKGTRDGQVILRYLQGLPTALIVAGTDINPADAGAIEQRLNGWCGQN